MKQIVLASASPRRRALMEQLGLPFIVDASGIAEPITPGRKPEEMVMEIAQAKAVAVMDKYSDAVIIAADTIGVLTGDIIGKPESPEDAIRILRKLSGRTHAVITGLAVLNSSTGLIITEPVITYVEFYNLDESEIQAYVATGESLDKAGAYAIQGRGAMLVKRIGGDYYNVIGLPIGVLARTLRDYFHINVLG